MTAAITTTFKRKMATKKATIAKATIKVRRMNAFSMPSSTAAGEDGFRPGLHEVSSL